MAVLTNSGIITTVRARVGDDDSSNYLAPDTNFTEFVTEAKNNLNKYARKEVEDTSITGDGTNVSYTLPAGVYKEQITTVFIRTNSDSKTDREIKNKGIHHGKIYFPYALSTSQTVIIWSWTNYVIGTDDIPDHHAHLLYKLVEREWYSFAIAKRADFEQWAATQRSDSNVAVLRSMRDAIDKELDMFAATLGNTLMVSNLWG